MERQVRELTDERDAFREQIAGYSHFALPIAITEQELEVKYSEGDTGKFD